MATLKEIKNRIQSVKSTQKITSAMKMVSSAKLRKAEKAIESTLPYKNALENITHELQNNNREFSSPLNTLRPLTKVAIVVFSSNSSLCGGFNSGIAKALKVLVDKYKTQHVHLEIIPIGKKITQFCSKSGYQTLLPDNKLVDKPEYDETVVLSKLLIEKFVAKEFDKIELLYSKYNSKSNQKITVQQFLPIEPQNVSEIQGCDYMIEPVADLLLESVYNQLLSLTLFDTLQNNVASEHAARTTAMQIATDNASDLLQELSLQYNKSRQQSITNELLDILGGSFK